MYVLRKLADADAVSLKNWDMTFNQIKKELDDEASEGGFSQSVGAASEAPKTAANAKVEEVSVPVDAQSHQSASGLTAEVDEKTFEHVQQDQQLLKDPQIGGSQSQSEQHSKDVQ